MGVQWWMLNDGQNGECCMVGVMWWVLCGGCYVVGVVWRVLGGGDSSVDRSSGGRISLQGQLSVLTLISVSVPPPCYRSST